MAINYVEKGIGLHDAIADAGLHIWQGSDGWHAEPGKEATVQAIIDAFDERAYRIAALVPKIKLKARDVILATLPEWKQANMTARAVELVGAGQATGPEWEAMQALWAWVKAVRQHSDALEAQAAADPGSVDIDTGWPVAP